MMGRIGEREVIVNAVVFVVQPEAGWVTEQMLTVDAGGYNPITVRTAPAAAQLRTPERCQEAR